MSRWDSSSLVVLGLINAVVCDGQFGCQIWFESSDGGEPFLWKVKTVECNWSTGCSSLHVQGDNWVLSSRAKTKPHKESINYFVPPTLGGHDCRVTTLPSHTAYFLTPVDRLQIALALLCWAEWDKQCLDNLPPSVFYIIDAANLITSGLLG